MHATTKHCNILMNPLAVMLTVLLALLLIDPRQRAMAGQCEVTFMTGQTLVEHGGAYFFYTFLKLRTRSTGLGFERKSLEQ
jgi:hypothetical protein